jgi:hypothetical protein
LNRIYFLQFKTPTPPVLLCERSFGGKKKEEKEDFETSMIFLTVVFVPSSLSSSKLSISIFTSLILLEFSERYQEIKNLTKFSSSALK